MTSSHRYSEYKPSKIDWLGEVPTDWEVVPLKRRATTGAGAGFPHEFQGQAGGEIPFYKVNSLAKAGKDGVIDFVDEAISRETALGLRAKIHPAGSAVLAKIGAALLLGRIRMLGVDACIDNNMMSVIATRGTDPRFLYFALTLIRFDLLVNPGAVPSTSEGAVAEWKLAFPSLEEQRAIADFLDRDTARIDDLIGKQERLIELLAERRRTTINEAYASEAAPAKLRHVVQFAQTGPFGTQLSAEEYVANGVPVINPTHIRNGEITPDLTISVTPGKAAELTRHRLVKGDIILGRKGEVDKSARATHYSEGFICGSDSMLLRPKTSTDSDYLWWFFQSPKAHAQLELWSVGSTVTGLNQTTMSKIRLPLPSLAEQRAVARLLADATRKIDRLIEKTAQSIVLLRERRSALISAAVTGKIDVTNEGVAA